VVVVEEEEGGRFYLICDRKHASRASKYVAFIRCHLQQQQQHASSTAFKIN